MRELLTKHYGTIYNCPFRGPLYIHAKAPREHPPQKNHKHGSQTKEFYKNKDTSKHTGPPKHKLIDFIQKWTQYSLMTRMTIFIIWKITMKILTLLIHKNKTWKILRLNKNNSTKTQMMNLSLKKNSNIFTQNLIKEFYHQQLTQVSYQPITFIYEI